MKINYKQCESKERPLEIDVTSSPNGVYVRRNIELVLRGEDGSEMYSYQEAFLTQSEYEQYSKDLLVGQMNGKDNSKEYEVYDDNLDSGVEYTNGHRYKPYWADIYYSKVKEVMEMASYYEKLGGTLIDIPSAKIAVFDDTAKPENAVLMSVKEVIELWFFLRMKQDEYFNEYKASLGK